MLPIITYPHPVLAATCRPVGEIDATARRLAQDLLDTLAGSDNGIGLAAPQVGFNLAMVALEADPDQGRGNRVVLIDPMIVAAEGEATAEEGCLSLPGHWAPVTRAARVRVRARDLKGKTFELAGEGLLARLLQHELDHLVGKLVVDYQSPLKRALYRKKCLKDQRRAEA